MNLNKVFLIGRLTGDPQLRTTPNGHQVATFSVATNRVWNDKIAGRRKDTEFHNIVVWERQAEVASRFLAKGSLVFIEGRLQTRGWEDQQGQKRRTTEIVAERLQLGPRPRPLADQPAPALTEKDLAKSEVPVIDISEEIVETAPVPEPGEIKKEDLPF